MKVNISYTVDLDKVPNEVDRLMKGCKNQFALLADKIESLSIVDLSVFIEDLRSCRQQMVEIDNRLNDCVAILEGYMNAKNAPPPQSMPVEEAVYNEQPKDQEE